MSSSVIPACLEEHEYIVALLGQRVPLTIPEGEEAAIELLRIDWLWGAGEKVRGAEALNRLVDSERWRTCAPKGSTLHWIGEGLKALFAGELEQAYTCFLNSSKAGLESGQASGESIGVFAGERAVNIAFWMACAGKMLCAGEVLSRVVDTRPFAGGILAFAQHMAGNSLLALATANRAIDLGFDDPWTVHAVAHAMYSMGRSRECAQWIENHRSSTIKCSTFMKTHMDFHLALCMLDLGDGEGFVRLLDGPLWGQLTLEERSDYWAATGVLNAVWKAELRGVICMRGGIDDGDVHDDRTTTATISLGSRAMKCVCSALDHLRGAAPVSKSKVFSLCMVRWLGEKPEWQTWHRELIDAIKSQGHKTFSTVTDAILTAYHLPAHLHPDKDSPMRDVEVQWKKCASMLVPIADQLHQLGASPEQQEVIDEFAAVALHRAGERTALDAWLGHNEREGIPWYEEIHL